MKLGLLILCLLAFGLDSLAQKEEQSVFGFIEPKFHSGHPIKYSDSLNHDVFKPYKALDLRFGIYDRGSYKQSAFFNGASYGVGFYVSKHNMDTLGDPMAVYLFYNAPFFRADRFSFNWEIASGLGWGFNEYDPMTNPRNDLIGAEKNIFVSLNAFASYQLTKRLDASFGFHFSHFSNGTLNMPNKGINMYGGNMSLRYHFNSMATEYRASQIKAKETMKAHRFSFTFGSGTKTTLEPWVNEKFYMLVRSGLIICIAIIG